MVVAFAGGVGTGPVAEYGGGGVEEGLKFCVQFAVVEPGCLHAATEDGEFGEQRRGEGLFGMVMAEGFEEMGCEGVDLVVGTGCLVGELKHAHICGFHVEGYCADVVIDMEHDIAGGASMMRHVSADETGECTVDHFHKVALFEVDVIEGEVWETVVVGAGDIFEIHHLPVRDDSVAESAGSVEEERETVVLCAEETKLGECAAYEYVMESEVDGAHLVGSVFFFTHYVCGGEELEVGALPGVEAVDGFAGHIAQGSADMIQYEPMGCIGSGRHSSHLARQDAIL